MKANLHVALPKWVNIFRRYPYWAKARCIFVHVPKAAGTSMNHALYGRTLGHYTIEEIRRVFPGLVESCFVFSIVRCPFARLYSAYCFAKAGQTADMGISNPSRYKVPEFGSFERFVLEWLVHQSMENCDHVFRPQEKYVCIDGAIAVNQIIRIEQLSSAVPQLERRLGRPLLLRPRNVTSGGARDAGHYTPEMRDAVLRIYERDFELFGYGLQPPTRDGELGLVQ